MTAEHGDMIIIPYEYIKVDFNSIEKGKLNIITPQVPNGGTKIAKWQDTNDYETITEVSYTYKGKTNNTQFSNISSLIKNGVCEEYLCDLEDGNLNSEWLEGMFRDSKSLVTFNSDLTSITKAKSMFFRCPNLKSFNSDLRNLTNGYDMFNECRNLETFNSNLSSLTHGAQMFTYTSLSSFTLDMNKLIMGANMF